MFIDTQSGYVQSSVGAQCISRLEFRSFGAGVSFGCRVYKHSAPTEAKGIIGCGVSGAVTLW
jgi:hypothetical protein